MLKLNLDLIQKQSSLLTLYQNSCFSMVHNQNGHFVIVHCLLVACIIFIKMFVLVGVLSNYPMHKRGQGLFSWLSFYLFLVTFYVE